MFKKANKKGFTLIELIIVVAIMAVLVALLAPNVLKYLEKSKVGKDINSLDSVRLGIEAELMDEKLSSLTTGTTGSGDTEKIKGIFLADIADDKASDDFDTLADRLFGEAMVLSEEYEDGNPFTSKAAKNAQIAVFIDGNGGVAVAAIVDGAIAEYNGQQIVVFTKLAVADLDPAVQSLGNNG